MASEAAKEKHRGRKNAPLSPSESCPGHQFTVPNQSTARLRYRECNFELDRRLNYRVVSGPATTHARPSL